MAFYVSAIKRGQKALVLGPFRRHGDALAAKYVARRAAERLFNDVDAFDTRWGTARDGAGHRPGKLNDHVDITVDDDGYITEVAA
jgi:hypothetical protein